MSTHVGDTIRTRIEMSLAYSKEIELSKKVKLKLPLRELVNRFPVNVPYPKRRNAPITEAVENSKIAEQCKISKVIMLQPVQIERIARIDPDEAVRRLMLWEELAHIFWVGRLFIPYAYCDPKFDLHELRKKQREILQRALKDVPCYELRFRKFAYNLVKKLLID